MKIFVTGISGQLGYDVMKAGLANGFEMFGASSKELDITKETDVENYVTKLKPDAIIHCAAYTAVDLAEDETEQCYAVNVNGAKYLAQVAKKVNAKFAYISTDYVFDGQGKAAFSEVDSTNPIGYYGTTKLLGEQIVQETLENYFIVRISWVFGKNGNNFVKTMLKLSESRKELNVVGDQIGSPTYTVDLAKLLIEMVQTNKYGIYHASNEGFCSWAEFATEIFKQARKDVTVNAITTSEYPTKAKRPENSRMRKDKLASEFHLLPPWQDALNRYLKEINLNG
ncbi:dTDP-4-dehydrorhamnose reductase [Solibacillus sp. FSL R7-0668]|uniref:dTDP-4-dehydrorhamnose reductase n=1 Tax=Solibacillus sp. FSL R7-0668 TaxID=2921688 RepID=UPI0030F7F0B2